MAIICGKHRHDTVAQVRACQLGETAREVESIRPISPAGVSLARGAGIPLAEIEASRAHWAEGAQTEYVGGTVVWDKAETTEPVEEVWPWAKYADEQAGREQIARDRSNAARRQRTSSDWTPMGAPAATDAQKSYLSNLLASQDVSECASWAATLATNLEAGRVTKNGASAAITRLKRLPRKSEPAPAVSAPNQDAFPDVPAGRYALRSPISGVVKFYVLDRPTQGRWVGAFFLNAQASSEKYPIKNPVTKREILSAIAEDPQAAQILYGQELGRCYACGRVLTDETSRALGIGPDCRSK